MYIQNDNGATRTLYDEEVMAGEYGPPGIEFSERGVAQVQADVGEALVDRYDTISVHETEEE